MTDWIFRISEQWWKMRQPKDETETFFMLWGKYLRKAAAIALTKRNRLSKKTLEDALSRAAKEQLNNQIEGQEAVKLIYPEPSQETA